MSRCAVTERMHAMRVAAVQVLAALTLTVILVLLPRIALAQVDPRGAVRTIRTEHFRVHFPVALDSLARRAALHAESAYSQFAGELATPQGPIDLLLIDNVDASNGFAQVFPTNRIVIYAVPPITSRELRFHDDWLRLVITHELAHTFHLDRARGLWRVGRVLFGRNPVLFPNAFTPSWVKEGLAVHYESKFTGSGRAVSTEFPLLARAAARDAAIPGMGRWSLSTSRFPRGQTAYGWGTLMLTRADSLSPLGMRRYVDATASYLNPFALQRSSRVGFGQSFAELFATYRDSLTTARIDRSGDAEWHFVSTDGWYAASPRWISADSLVWSASTGREVTGMYVGSVATPGITTRVAWRNSLDANVPALDDATGAQSVVFAQFERLDPYVVRSDLYRGTGTREARLTHGARLTQPDVRRDGAIVAVQLDAAASRLVRVSADGTTIIPVTRDAPGHLWAEPRWSPDGGLIAAVQLLPTGEQRVVVLDTTGALRLAVAGARSVFASPSFTPDGARLVWSSDRSGRMQLETAPIALALGTAAVDTLGWRTERADVRVMSAVSTGVYEPTVSPDGQLVAALVTRVDGSRVAWTPLDTTGPMARSTWYPAQNAVRAPPVSDSARIVTGASTRYAPLRQLVPRYWLPLIGEGRDGRITYGASSSSVDILGRHAWNAGALVEPQRREFDAFAAYRYAGLGVPVFDVSATRAWDGTIRSVNDSGQTLGLLARQRQFFTASATWARPRVRRSLSTTFGAQYERREFNSATDSALGPANSFLRRGTRYPSLFASGSISTARLALRGISVEEGITLATNTSYRWREDAPSLGSWRTVLSARAFQPLNGPGFARHVLALRGTVGVADTRTTSEFSVGGVSGLSAELVPGVTVGDPSRAFALRGVAPGIQRGIRAAAASAEYRAPLVMFSRLPNLLSVYTDRLSVALFSDVARAWCPASLARANTVVCERVGEKDGWLASAGAELVIDLAVQYDVPYRVRVGAAAPYRVPVGVARGGSVYVTLGSYF